MVLCTSTKIDNTRFITLPTYSLMGQKLKWSEGPLEKHDLMTQKVL